MRRSTGGLSFESIRASAICCFPETWLFCRQIVLNPAFFGRIGIFSHSARRCPYASLHPNQARLETVRAVEHDLGFRFFNSAVVSIRAVLWRCSPVHVLDT